MRTKFDLLVAVLAIPLCACGGDNGATDAGNDAAAPPDAGADVVTTSDASADATGDGAVVCDADAGLTDCGGQCVDLTSNGTNCGACGHDCLGGTCAAGECGAMLLGTVTNGAANMSDIAVDGTNVYVSIMATAASGGGVVKVPIGGGSVTSLVSGQITDGNAQSITVEYVKRVAAGGGKVYFAEGLSSFSSTTRAYYMGSIPSAGGTVTPYKGPLSATMPTGLATDASGSHYAMAYYNYTAASTGNSVGAADMGTLYLDTGKASSGVAVPHDIRMDGTDVYWVDYDLGTVSKSPLSSISATQLAGSETNPSSLAVDSGYAYWCNANSGAIRRVATGGGSVTTVASPGFVDGLVADANNVYYALSGKITSVPVGGGTTHDLPGTTGAGRLARDAKAIYFYDPSSGHISKIALP
jgi:hypothetical protein